MRKFSFILLVGWLFSSLVPPTFANVSTIQLAGVITGEADISLQIQATTNDPFYGDQWYLRRIGVDRAWDTTTGSNNLVIAVIDTGVNTSHEELASRLWSNPNEIPGNGKDDDGNGYVDDYTGYNFMDDNSDIVDFNGHGTGIASIIAARTNNGRGLAGVNWQSKIMVLKALNSVGGGDFSDVAKAIRYAVDNGANIINMSFGATTSSPVLADAVDYAIARNVPIVAAVGNNSSGSVFYPARYSSVIAVGSFDANNQLSTFSNYGAGVDLVAPGESIIMAGISPAPYVEGAGSSFAAALVTGVASLLLSRSPYLSVDQLENILKTTADSVGDSLYFGAGRINAARAITAQAQSFQSQFVVTPSSAVADGLARATITATLTDGGGVPQVGVAVRANVSGINNIVNGQLVTNSATAIGTTDSNGRITFTLSSTAAEVKQISLIHGALGAVVGNSATVTFTVPTRPAYSMQWLQQSPYPTLAIGATTELWVEVRNTGNVTWVSDARLTSLVGQTRLGTDRPMDRSSAVYHSGAWLSNNRAALMTPNLVRPNEVARFLFTINGNQIGSFKEYFRPVVEHQSWLNDLGIYWDINVTASGVASPSSPTADFNPAAYTALLNAKSSDLILSPSQSALVSVELTNTGSATWLGQGTDSRGTGEVRIGTTSPRDRVSQIVAPNWISNNRIISTGFDVPPNAQVELTFTVQAPAQVGTYTEQFQLVSEYITWFGPTFSWAVTVR